LPRAGAWQAEGEGRAALLVFTDGGMQHARPADYELFELRTRTARRAHG